MKKVIGALVITILLGGYNFAGAALTDGLVAHYEFEDNANDSSGNGNTGTEYGGISYVDGKIGRAASFDGINDFINTGLSVADFASKSMSLSAWVYLKSTSDAPAILGTTEHGNLGGIFLRLYTNNNTRLSSYNGSSWDAVYDLTDQPSLFHWHHYAFTYDASTKNAIIYKDGFKIATGTLDGIYNFNSNVFTIANTNSNSHLKGEIDEVRIYNRALITSEIAELTIIGTTEHKDNPQNDVIDSEWQSFKNDVISFTGEALSFAANSILVAGHIIIPSDQPLLRHWISGAGGGNIAYNGTGYVTSASPSYFWMEGTLGSEVIGLSFDTVGSNLSDNDYIACFVNGELKYACPASHITNDTWFNSGFIDLSEYQDKSANIAVGIFTSEVNRTAYFKNLTFYKSSTFPWTMFLPAITGSNK